MQEYINAVLESVLTNSSRNTEENYMDTIY